MALDKTIESVNKHGDNVCMRISYRESLKAWIHGFDAAIFENDGIRDQLDHCGLQVDQWIDEGSSRAVERHR